MSCINKNAKTIKEDGYSYVMNQCLKVGTHIFSLGTKAENYEVYESIVTDEFKIDSFGYPCIVLKCVDYNLSILTRIELLVCSLHTHNSNDFLTREEAENARKKMLSQK